MELLKTIDAEAFVSYLAVIFEKLNILNKQLQGESKSQRRTKKNSVKCKMMTQ